MEALKKHLNWNYLSWAKDRFGALFAISHYRRMQVSIPTGMGSNRVLLRPGTMDQVVYDQVFTGREYDIDLGSPTFIVDAGAHIGLVSVFFAIRYPHARIVAIEPEPTNFALLSAHAQMYPQIIPIQAGLWSKEARLRISNPDGPSWSFRVEEASEGLKAVSVVSIMTRFGVSRIDVLKMDIEGCEIEVMNHSADWIDRVGALVIETHDRFKPGCTLALESAMGRGRWKQSVSGDSAVFVAIG